MLQDNFWCCTFEYTRLFWCGHF